METNENIDNKLKYIGLDLDTTPEKIAKNANVNFRVKRNYDEKSYKVYKYINVDDIAILLSPTHRSSDYTEKYAKALPLAAYLNPVDEEDMARYTSFINMIQNVSIDDIEKIEKEQQKYRKSIPNGITYQKDYLWQIYYAEDTKRYFMLFPTKENELETLFYIIKKQLENTNEKIYVPICYATYSHKMLYDSEIADVENYLCFFTKDWPLIHEVYDTDGNLSMQILGRTNIYDNIKSEYKIVLKSQDEARNFYQLLKAVFILETQLSHYYKFKIKIDKNGGLHFYHADGEITFENLPDIIKREYLQGVENITKTKEVKIKLTKELKLLKKQANELDQEYYEREKQIAIYLECKKTFFGKIKYFLKYKNVKSLRELATKVEKKEESSGGTLKYFEKMDIKEHYNLETLIKLYENLDSEYNDIRDLEQDIGAMKKRIEMMSLKIESANKYIKDIDEHKKSIFEFWRFTKRDEIKQLDAGEEERNERKKTKIKKAFNFESDFEDLGKQFDKAERDMLSRTETNSVYIFTTKILEDINLILNHKEIPQAHLDSLKEELENENKIKTVDIFGSIAESQEKIKTLGNIRHRENEKNKFAILGLKENTTLKEYKSILEEIIEEVENTVNKFKTNIDIPVYMVGSIKEKYNIFYLDPEMALKKATKSKENLYKFNLSEGTNCVPLCNIMYYNNDNGTLPLGMMVSSGVLLNINDLNLKSETVEENYKVEFNPNETKATELNIYKYDV